MGQMTAVMRAMSAHTGPKVLRIGVVERGRIVEERIIKRRTTVSVGSHEGATFVISSHAVPSKLKLFELVDGDYFLTFIDGMSGRVALASGITDVHRSTRIKLSDDARGKIVVGETTFLFQFVRPPPPPSRPQLPLAVKGGIANQIDWSLTIIAACSFLLHFGIVGAMYSDWMDRVVADDYTVAGLVDMVKSIPAPLATETPVETNPNPTTAAPTPATPQKTASTVSHAPSGSKPAPSTGINNAQAAVLAANAEQMGLDMIGSVHAKSSVQTTLDRSAIPPVDLTSAAASNKGIAMHGPGDLNVHGGGPVQGNGKNGLAIMGGPTTGTTDGKAGEVRTVAGPKIDTQIGGLSASTTVTGADRVVAGLRGRFRACYQTGLNLDSTMSGKVVISAKVASNGEVASADIASNTGLSAGVATCIADVVKRAQFDAPSGGGSSMLSIPVTFVQSK